MTDYLQQRRERLAHDVLKRRIVVGLLIGWALTLWGGWRYYFVELADTALWGGVMAAGLLCLLLSILLPDAFAWPEKLVHTVGQFIFRMLLLALLTVIYVLLIIPLSLFTRRRSERGLSSAWSGAADRPASAWGAKSIVEAGGKRAASLLTSPLYVLSYFFNRGHYLLMPVLIILILIGMALLFLQTSAIAPMIYTLF